MSPPYKRETNHSMARPISAPKRDNMGKLCTITKNNFQCQAKAYKSHFNGLRSVEGGVEWVVLRAGIHNGTFTQTPNLNTREDILWCLTKMWWFKEVNEHLLSATLCNKWIFHQTQLLPNPQHPLTRSEDCWILQWKLKFLSIHLHFVPASTAVSNRVLLAFKDMNCDTLLYWEQKQ